jgi:hypothetical protein
MDPIYPITFGAILLSVGVILISKTERSLAYKNSIMDEVMMKVHTDVNPGQPLLNKNDKLVHVLGKLKTDLNHVDEEFDVQVNSLSLKRKVEMLSLVEKVIVDNIGRKTERKDYEYEYTKECKECVVNHNGFLDKNKVNLNQMPLKEFSSPITKISKLGEFEVN